MKKFDEMTEHEKMQKVFSHAQSYCQAAIDNAINFSEGDREVLEQLSAWIEFNEQMSQYVIDHMDSEFDRDMLGNYGIHVYSERLRNSVTPPNTRSNSPR